MYKIVKMIGVLNGVNQRWIEIDKERHTVSELCQYFRKCFITLSDINDAVVGYLNLDDIKSTYLPYNDKLGNLLQALGDRSLPLTDVIPNINVRRARFRDAFSAGYTIASTHPLYGANAAPDEKSAILLTRAHPVTDYEDFYDHCLVSINGFYHMTDTNKKDGIVVYDAMKSLTVSNQNQVGILSFKEIGALKLLPITRDMLYKQNENEPYRSAVYIKIEQDITNKSVMMVIGGYLHAVDNLTFNKVADNCYKVDMSNYPLLDRYYESSNYIDMSGLGLSTTDRNKEQISTTELMMDETIIRYLTLSQSFFVIVDTPELFTAKQYIKRSNLCGMYVSYIEPKCSLVTGLGRHPEYLANKEDGQWAVTVQDNTVQNKIYNTVNQVSLVSVDDTSLPKLPERLSGAYFLEIGSDI